MNRIKLNEKSLKQIIRESIKSTLNEASNQGYTFNQLLSKEILGQEFRGDPRALANYVTKAYQQLCKEKGVRPMQLNSNTPYPSNAWVQILNKAKAMDRTGTLKGTFDTMITGITAKTPQQGAQDALNNGGYMQAGNQYSTGPGDKNVSPKGKMTYSQLTNAMANVGDRTMTFQMALNDSVGPWNGQNPQTVKNIIASQIRTRKQTALQKFGQQNVATAEAGLNNWLNGGNQAIRGRQVHSWMNVFDQLATSRNDRPIVIGFQKAANFFAGKKVLAVDGAIGQNTSAALRQAGFKDIFEFENVVKKVQARLGVNPDGQVGNNTIAAFQKAGIRSFEDLKNYTGSLAVDMQNVPAVNPQNQIQGQVSPGQLAERKRMKVSESELKKVIRESVNDVLREMRLK